MYLSKLEQFQQRVSIITWGLTLCLSLRGLFEFYGMKQPGPFEQAVRSITEPFVQLFAFKELSNIDIPAIGVLFAVVSLLLCSYLVQLSMFLVSRRFMHARTMVLQQMIQTKN